MYKPSLDLKISDDCIACSACVRECANHVLTLDPATRKPIVVPGGADRCIHCTHCLLVCPENAFFMDGIRSSDCAPVAPGPDFSSLLNLVKARRSVRHYRQIDVHPETIAELLDAMRHVPTGVNFGHLHFSLIDQGKVMKEFRARMEARLTELIEGAAPDDPRFAHYRNLPKAIQSGDDPIFRTAPHLILAAYREDAPCGATDSVIALSYFELLAAARGVGTVWCGRIMNLMNALVPEFIADFRLPSGYKPGYAMLFGYAANHFYRTPDREPPTLSRVESARK